MENQQTAENNLSLSEEFEKELDEYFKERAQFRSRHFTDNSKQDVAGERTNRRSPFTYDSIGGESSSAVKNNVSNLNYSSSNMSGCCMSGCFDCPWSYEAGK